MYICIYHFCSWLAWRQGIGLGYIYSWGYMSGGYEHEKGEPFAQSSLIHFIVISYTIPYPYIRRKRLTVLPYTFYCHLLYNTLSIHSSKAFESTTYPSLGLSFINFGNAFKMSYCLSSFSS